MRTSSPSGTRSTHRCGRRIAEERGDQPALRRVERGGADEALALDVDLEPGGGLDALDDRWSSDRCRGRGGARRCGSSPARGGRAASARPSTATPRATPPWSGRSVKHGVSASTGVAEAVPPHGAVVAGLLVADLGRVGVAGVGEAGAVGQPRHRRGPGVGDGVGEQRAGGDVEHPQRRALVAAGGGAEGDERAVGRRLVPVDRGGDLAGRVGRVDQHPTRAR